MRKLPDLLVMMTIYTCTCPTQEIYMQNVVIVPKLKEKGQENGVPLWEWEEGEGRRNGLVWWRREGRKERRRRKEGGEEKKRWRVFNRLLVRVGLQSWYGPNTQITMSIAPMRHGVVHATCTHSVAALRYQWDTEPQNQQKEGKRGRESGKRWGSGRLLGHVLG